MLSTRNDKRRVLNSPYFLSFSIYCNKYILIILQRIETQFGVNHVGHFMLTVGLIPRLIEGSPSRVVTLSSAALVVCIFLSFLYMLFIFHYLFYCYYFWFQKAGIRWDDINFEKHHYGKWEAYPNLIFILNFIIYHFNYYLKYFRYGQSKTANALFALELNRRYRDQGITSNAVHPGIIPTNLQRHGIFI